MKRVPHKTWLVFGLVVLALLVVMSLWLSMQSPRVNGSATSADVEPVQVTLWTSNAELFLEYPVLIAGQQATFAAHVTDLRTFQPVTEGQVEVSLRAPGESTVSTSAPAPARPGIFTPRLVVPEAGAYDLTLALSSPSLTETFSLGAVRVFATQAALHDRPADPSSTLQGQQVDFLKEQQWKIAFATELAAIRPLASTIPARGLVKPKMGSRAVVTAVATGVLVLPPTNTLPIVGQFVAKDEPLVAITPIFPNASRAELEAAVRQTSLEREHAQRELWRAKKLFEGKAAPRRRVEEATTAYLIAKNRHEEAQRRLATLQVAQQLKGTEARDRSQDFIVRAPISGTIVEAQLTLGARVDAGDGLYTIIDVDTVWIEAQVYAADVTRIAPNAQAAFQPQGVHERMSPDTRLVTIGQVINPSTKTVPVIFEVANRGHRLKIGLHTDVFIETGRVIDSVSIPRGAILDEGGQPIAYVQVGGESFEKRTLTIGFTSMVNDREFVQILKGIAPGERVVTEGTYAVKLASSSGEIPAHSHE